MLIVVLKLLENIIAQVELDVFNAYQMATAHQLLYQNAQLILV